MIKFLLGSITGVAGLVAYWATFTVFYDSWFPYYYENYITYWFLAGAALILAGPIIFSKISARYFGSIGFYGSVLRVNLGVVVACVLVFTCMLANGTYLVSGSPSSYQVVPENESKPHNK